MSLYYIQTTYTCQLHHHQNFMDNLNKGESVHKYCVTIASNCNSSKAETFCQLGRTKFALQQGLPALLHTSTEPQMCSAARRTSSVSTSYLSAHLCRMNVITLEQCGLVATLPCTSGSTALQRLWMGHSSGPLPVPLGVETALSRTCALSLLCAPFAIQSRTLQKQARCLSENQTAAHAGCCSAHASFLLCSMVEHPLSGLIGAHKLTKTLSWDDTPLHNSAFIFCRLARCSRKALFGPYPGHFPC